MQSNHLTDLADAVAAFNPEPEELAGHVSKRVSGVAQATLPVHAGSVSLDDLVSRDIAIEWDEAVAVVEELCSVVTAGAKESPIPGLGGILITASGGVRLSAVGGEPGANAAGRTLNALLSSTSVPVPLRLFVTQSTAPETYGSVREFAAALAYFSKPGRADLIRALYQRGASGLAASLSESPRKRSRPDPTLAIRMQETSKRPGKRPAWAFPAFAVVAATSLLAVGIWLWSAAAPEQTAGSSTLSSQATNGVESLRADVRESLGTGAPPRVDNVGRDDRPAPAAPANRAASAIRPPARTSEAPQTARATAPAQPPPDEAMVSVVLTDILPTPSAEARALRGVDLLVIYSSADTNVEPPTLLYTQLPGPIVVDRRHAALNTMEVVVSELGTVERVRLIAGPTRMPDMMLLSGAKTWQFKPAMKDDVPVRYRAILSWSSVP